MEVHGLLILYFLEGFGFEGGFVFEDLFEGEVLRCFDVDDVDGGVVGVFEDGEVGLHPEGFAFEDAVLVKELLKNEGEVLVFKH